MTINRMFVLACTALVTLAATGNDVRAQNGDTGIGDDAFAPTCPYRGRWLDALGKCVECCNPVEYACPCSW